MSDEILNNVQDNIRSVSLTPLGNIIGNIGASSFIINDYVLTITEGENGYILSITKGSQTQTAIIRDAISVESVTQIVESDEDHGVNTFRVTLTDGTYQDFNYYNGNKGDKGDPGLTQQERQEIFDAEAGRVAAENLRVSAESGRIENENERVLYETIRRGEEAERVVKEKNRISAETNRVNAESAREAAESVRAYNEGQRNTNEAERQSEWTGLKSDFADAIDQIVDLQEDVQELSDKVDGAAGDVLEAYINVNNEITRAESVLQEVEEASSDIIGMTAEASTLSPGSQATASYYNGVLTIGVPQGQTGEAFHIVKTYSSIAEMNADYSSSDVHVGDFVMITSNVQDPDNAKVYVKGSEAFTFVVDMSGSAGIKGDPGISPSVSVQNITGGHRVTITDSVSPKVFDVMDGASVSNIYFQIDDNGNLKYLLEIQ